MTTAATPNKQMHRTAATRCSFDTVGLFGHWIGSQSSLPAAVGEFTWSSPEGEIIGAGKEISEELGRKPDSTDLNERHPFDVEICRIPPGKTPLHLAFP
jgi:hypothetical protein